jgi:hypothetical protein
MNGDVKTEVKLTTEELEKLQARVPGGEDLDRTVLIRKLLGLPNKIQRLRKKPSSENQKENQ